MKHKVTFVGQQAKSEKREFVKNRRDRLSKYTHRHWTLIFRLQIRIEIGLIFNPSKQSWLNLKLVIFFIIDYTLI